MIVHRKCIECNCKFSYSLFGKRIRKLCENCVYQRRLDSNKRYKKLHSEKNKAYHKAYYRMVRERQLES